MGKKWYNLFVSVEGPEQQETSEPASTAAQTVAEIAKTVAPEPRFTAPVADAMSFVQIYEAAEIAAPAHGYTVMKVGDMLQSEHIRTLPREVKRSSVLVALEAAGVSIQDVIQDAVKRDRALDAFERVQQKALEELETRKAQENQQIQAEMDRLVAEYRSRIQANNDEVAKGKERFFGWRLKKQEEEQKIAETVTHFVTENPITTRGGGSTPPDNT